MIKYVSLIIGICALTLCVAGQGIYQTPTPTCLASSSKLRAPMPVERQFRDSTVMTLPFYETFYTGMLETNGWTTDSENWHISNQVGLYAPSVEFSSNPVQTNYSLSLTSNWLDGVNGTSGDIYLSFDLMIDDTLQTGTEHLLVEVYNGTSWDSVATYTAEGDVNWERKQIEITDFVEGQLFKVRLMATGANSTNINKWCIDNIGVYSFCGAPYNLKTDINMPHSGCEILVTWDPPVVAPPDTSGWLNWDNGINDDAIGLNNGETYTVGVRFTADQLTQYLGGCLTRIRMFAYGSGGTLVLKVWIGANANQLVLSQPVASYEADSWNEFALNTPICIWDTTELWFGYEVTNADDYVAGCDAGPAVAGYGDMVSMNGTVWQSMSSTYGLNHNWNIQGYIEQVSCATTPLQPGSRELIRYNVYREGEFYATTTNTYYIDRDSTFTYPRWLRYKVSAVYGDCESEYSNEHNSQVCPLGKAKSVDLTDVYIYPNPGSTRSPLV